jgi:hypothetical protein
MTFFNELSHPRAKESGEWTAKQHPYPEFRLEATADEERTATWEAHYADGVHGARPAASRKALLAQAMDENLAVAAAAQANQLITANDLHTLLVRRLLVEEGALANPNIGGLDFTVQADLAFEAFPEHRLIAAQNTGLHVELLAKLADEDEDAGVRDAARDTIARLDAQDTITDLRELRVSTLLAA